MARTCKPRCHWSNNGVDPAQNCLADWYPTKALFRSLTGRVPSSTAVHRFEPSLVDSDVRGLCVIGERERAVVEDYHGDPCELMCYAFSFLAFRAENHDSGWAVTWQLGKTAFCECYVASWLTFKGFKLHKVTSNKENERTHNDHPYQVVMYSFNNVVHVIRISFHPPVDHPPSWNNPRVTAAPTLPPSKSCRILSQQFLGRKRWTTYHNPFLLMGWPKLLFPPWN